MSDDAPTSRRTLPPQAVDPWLLAAVLLLTGIGLVMVYSASAVTADARVHDQFYYLKRQLVAAGLGMGFLLLLVRLGYRRLEALAVPLLIVVVLALVAVLVPGIGKVAGGARRWIDLGVLRFQPAEAAKVVLVLYLARSLARKRERVKMFSIGFLPHVAVTGLLVALVLLEKDLGTAVILLVVLFVMLFAGGVKLGYLVGAVLLAIPIGWKLVAGTPYRMQRITAFLDPWQHRDGIGFQIVESLLGIGNGGWFGQGLGEGKGKLFYLPAAHTDFIAAVIAEETGLVGTMLLVLLFALLFWRGLRATALAPDPFGCYLALGLTTLVTSQALVNLAVVLGLAPTKGLTLPFVSYGGSSLMTMLAAAGMLLSVSAGSGGFLRPQRSTRVAAAAAGSAS
ncbi:MAG TPA: putative lipid II flippase FtsW [Anaeromyxobacteraceae bacterium]|nr:putative lipid II flippase FtsW [Anaeromyxobacteraceae bacterium]